MIPSPVLPRSHSLLYTAQRHLSQKTWLCVTGLMRWRPTFEVSEQAQGLCRTPLQSGSRGGDENTGAGTKRKIGTNYYKSLFVEIEIPSHTLSVSGLMKISFSPGSLRIDSSERCNADPSAEEMVIPFSQRLMVGSSRSAHLMSGLPSLSLASQYPRSSPGTPEAPGPFLLLRPFEYMSLLEAIGAISLATKLTCCSSQSLNRFKIFWSILTAVPLAR